MLHHFDCKLHTVFFTVFHFTCTLKIFFHSVTLTANCCFHCLWLSCLSLCFHCLWLCLYPRGYSPLQYYFQYPSNCIIAFTVFGFACTHVLTFRCNVVLNIGHFDYKLYNVAFTVFGFACAHVDTFHCNVVLNIRRFHCLCTVGAA